MADFNVVGLDALMLSLDGLARLPNELLGEMLVAGAKVMESAQIGQLAADGLIDTGTLVASPGFNSKPRRRNGRLSIDVYPQGIHHDTPNGPVRNAEVAFIHEFGAPARGIKATQSMRKATERAAADVTEAERQVYEAWLYRLNL